jgi:isopentenyl phosphate kinase
MIAGSFGHIGAKTARDHEKTGLEVPAVRALLVG